MPEAGLFTRLDLKEAGKQQKRGREPDLPLESLWRMGPKGVSGMNPGAKHPEMAPTGNPKGRVYILGEAPGADEDETGKQFIGKSGQLLRSCLPKWASSDLRFDNTVRTRPPGNRLPTRVEVECFRPAIEESIAETKPEIILAVGGLAAGWFIPGFSKITILRGRRFPVSIKGHRCCVYPILHPSYVLRVEKQWEVPWIGGDVPGTEVRRFFERDIERAFRDLESAEAPEVEVLPKESQQEGCELLLGVKGDLGRVEKALVALARSNKPLAFDLETFRLRPYASDGRVLSIAISDGKNTLTFLLDHPDSRWREGELEQLKDLLRDFFTAGLRMVAHNLGFDLEWLLHLLGEEVAYGSRWEDTMQAGYVLDHRLGGLSLQFLCLQEFGLPLKSETEGGSMSTRLIELDPPKLLIYNALDAKYTARLFPKLLKRVKAEKLEPTYERQMDRVPALVLAQRVGVPVDQRERARLQEELGRKIDKLIVEMDSLPEVRVFNRRQGHHFSPASSQDCIILFRDILRVEEGHEEEKDGTPKYSTDEGVLSKVEKEYPAAKLLLAFRRLAKLKGTYVDSMVPGTKDSLVWPDGRLHCRFSATRTATGRTSSEEPNNQNWPKRKDKYVRKQIVPPKGCRIVSCDEGQIEARVIGMHSEDEEFCKALWTDYDIHMEWAERVAELHPPVLDAHEGNMKALRSAIKNELVFPAFYLASPKAIARYIGLPEGKANQLFAEFWETFKGVKKWQKRVLDFYEAKGYVQGLTGRRRWGPLSPSMAVNTPIQGDASDIVVASMVDLSRLSREEEKPWIQPVLNIHDDLTFFIPERELDESIKTIVRVMLKARWSWMNVPLSVEVEVGKTWDKMEPVGKFRSDRME